MNKRSLIIDQDSITDPDTGEILNFNSYIDYLILRSKSQNYSTEFIPGGYRRITELVPHELGYVRDSFEKLYQKFKEFELEWD